MIVIPRRIGSPIFGIGTLIDVQGPNQGLRKYQGCFLWTNSMGGRVSAAPLSSFQPWTGGPNRGALSSGGSNPYVRLVTDSCYPTDVR
jgi:hypothetical protein